MNTRENSTANTTHIDASLLDTFHILEDGIAENSE